MVVFFLSYVLVPLGVIILFHLFYRWFDGRRTARFSEKKMSATEEFNQLLADKDFDKAVRLLQSKGYDLGTATSWVASRIDMFDLLEWSNSDRGSTTR
jgi:hypothetical protein